MNSKRASVIVTTLFAAGLLLRLLLINTHASADLFEYIEWGQHTYESGLAKSFEGGYFPIQYLIFGASYAVAEHTSLTPEQVIRFVNLLFELGGLLLLVYLLQRWLSVQQILLCVWLNPFAIVMYQQGYVDSQFSFFILLTLLFLMRTSSSFTAYLIASIPLGISLLMKPQSAPQFVGLGILAVVCMFYKQWGAPLRIASIFIAPILLYAGFSLYFGFNLDINNNHKTLPRISAAIHEKTGLSRRVSDVGANSLFLTAQYVYVATQRLPAINAQMPNPWFFVASALNTNGGRIYLIKDTEKILGITYRTVGFLLFMAALLAIMLKLVKSNTTLAQKILLLTCFIPILLPYLTTSAHENHFYLGFMATIILGGLLADKFILVAGYTLGVLNAANLALYYLVPYYLDLPRSTTAIAAVTIASSIIFCMLLYHFIFKLRSEHLEISMPKSYP